MPGTVDLAAVLNTVLEGLIVIDHTGIIHTFNPAAAKIFGYSPEEVIGKNVKMLMPEPYQSGHDGYLTNYLTSHNPKVIGIGREVEGRRKNGETFPMDLGVNEMRIDGVLMFAGTVRDITEQKQYQKSIDKYIKALKKSNQELDDFAYIASHDLKEPLRGLSNNALFLKEDWGGKLNEEAIQRIDRIIYLAERMEQLVNDLLYFSRIRKQELTSKSTSIKEVVRDVISLAESSIQENNVTITIANDLPEIVCDSVYITEVFRNLITNAIKYNDKEKKEIVVGYMGDDTFFVRDNGMGIAENYHEDIFRIFKRLNEEEDSVKGTGVGLTFVKKIVERHNGAIWLNSKEGEGTTFFFTIPQGVSNDK